MQQKMRVLMSVLAALFLVIFSACSGIDGDAPSNSATWDAPSSNATWTVMVYLDADNNLELFGLLDFNEIEQGLQNALEAGNDDIMENLNVVVLLDRCATGIVGNGYVSYPTEKDGSDWTDTRLYRVRPDTNSSYFNSERLDDGDTNKSWHTASLGEKNMGDPDTLSWFIGYTKENFPAQNYGLIFWNHGGGSRSRATRTASADADSTPAARSVAWDEDNGDDLLYTDEIQTALQEQFSSSDKLGLLGYDACLMGTVATAYEYRNLAEVMVASMNSEQGNGWDYTYIFGNLKDSKDESSLTPAAFASHIVDAYEDFCENRFSQENGETQSAIDLSTMDSLKSAIDALAGAIYSEYNSSTTNSTNAIEVHRENSVHFWTSDSDSVYYPYMDLGDFCRRLGENTGMATGIRTAASNVLSALATSVIKAYGQAGNNQSYYFGSGSEVERGLSLFFSRGNETYDTFDYGDVSHYKYQFWYTSIDLAAEYSDYSVPDGKLDFCEPGSSSGEVENWWELMEAWYDP